MLTTEHQRQHTRYLGADVVNLTMNILLMAGLVAASQSVVAGTFEFAGLSRLTTLQDVAKRYPDSTVSGSYVYVSPKDTHDHIFGIELSGPTLSNRFRINFGSPDHKYPLCETIEKSIISKQGTPSEVREFREEASQNRYLTWQLMVETVHLQCFRYGGNANYFAEAIAVYPKEAGPVLSRPAPGGQR